MGRNDTDATEAVEPPVERGPAGIPVDMVREDLASIPAAAPPKGYSFGVINREQIGLWLDIERDAETFFDIGSDIFAGSFGTDMAAISDRCYILYDDRGCGIGTISAWIGETPRGRDYGRIHWVALRPAYQGRGLGKILMSYGLEQLKNRNHKRAILSTQSDRIPAINLYLHYGFLPLISTKADEIAWHEVSERLEHPALKNLHGMAVYDT